MVDFYLIDINESIDGLSYEGKLEYLNEREDEINEEKEKLETLLSDIQNIRDEIEEEHQKELHNKVIIDLHNAGYNLESDSNGSISFSLEKIDVTINLIYIGPEVHLYFNAEKNQLSYRKLISSLLPDFKQDGNLFNRQVSEEELNMCVIGVVSKLMNNKQKFEEIGRD